MNTSRNVPTILVHEWVTGGGAADATLPPSWVAEGQAMRRAIAGEFAALDGGRSRVIVTLDARLDDDPGPWEVHRIGGSHQDRLRGLVQMAREADFTVLVAPETMHILRDLTSMIENAGGRLLGSSPEAVELAGDKLRLAGWLAERGIDTPPCRRVRPSLGLPSDADYPAVLKPSDGAGAVDTFLVASPEELPREARARDGAILQPYLRGRPMSASFVVDRRGEPWLVAIGVQHVAINQGRFAYQGGQLPVATPVDEGPIRAAVASVLGLQGFVGVDFLWDDESRRTIVLEINPRPTTSVVGLVNILPPGHLAAAWIGAFDDETAGARWLPGLADLVRSRGSVLFRAAGVIPGGGDLA
ncbi:MAG: ATP-grasp domain-containing protein [Isosphaeraceae bacterium]